MTLYKPTIEKKEESEMKAAAGSYKSYRRRRIYGCRQDAQGVKGNNHGATAA